MRLLVVTARYPTPDRPAAGAFVRERLGDPDVHARVVAPRYYGGSRWVRFARLTWEAVTARGRYDGVEGHFVLPTGPIALVAARLRQRPLVVYAHGGDVREAARGSCWRRWLARRVLRGADAVVTNSAESADHVRSLGGSAEVIPPGIDLARFSPRPRPHDRSVLYLGGTVPHKGVDIARRLATTLAGPGIREIDPAEVPALMAAHDVVLVPSEAEPYGVVAVEAIAAGRWVVASAVGGLVDIVTEGVNGTLVADGDFEAALAAVPDYDPVAVATTAERFGVERHWAGMGSVWERVRARPRESTS
ncbi:MAG TPA: glycosyltransferase [Candidatus Limnocylindria bacterium]|nr:glycosyltransferase [Candidatus Limnocylindria bacterium]